ncbi:MAG: response regulator [Bryobacteraceae bacterium]
MSAHPQFSLLRTVLVVDDAEDCAATIEIALQSVAGLAVRVAASAEDALRLLGEDHIAAIVTDLHLPSMDGLELVARVRAAARHSCTPIVVVSGDSDPATPERVMRAGANAFFAKPYSPSAVRKKLEELTKMGGPDGSR